MEEVRKISQNELMYLDMQDIAGSYSIHFFIEYEKEINYKEFETAVKKSVDFLTGASVKLYKDTYIKASYPEINIIETNNDDILNLDILKQKLDYTQKSIEIYIIRTPNKNYILYKLSHSVFDGKAALIFLENIFDFINGKEVKSAYSKLNDEIFTKDLNLKKEKLKCFNNFHLIKEGKRENVKWEIIEFHRTHKKAVARLAKVLSSCFTEDGINFMIPVDIRRHKQGRYITNLTLPIFLEVNKNDTIDDINSKLLFALQNNEELNHNSINRYNYTKIPKIIRLNALKTLYKIKKYKKSYMTGGIISYLGKINLENLSFKDNKAINFISLPIQNFLTPFSVVLSETDLKTTIALSYFEDTFSKKETDILRKKTEEAFVKKFNYEFNNTQTPETESFIEILAENIKNFPDNIAVSEGENKYTYRELDILSNKIAKNLKVKEGDKVILNMERSYKYIASILAIFKKRAVFIPVSTSEPQERVKDIYNKAGAKLILNDNNITEGTEQEEYTLKKYNGEIYNIFTSGTTGCPKLVKVSDKNFSNYIFWAEKTYKTPNNKVIMPFFTSISADLTLTSIFLPLITAGTIKVYKENFNQLILEDIFKDTEINIVKLTPAHLMLANNIKSKKKEYLIAGGDNFSSDLAENISHLAKNIVNEYGPSETTVGSTFYIFNENIQSEETNVPIGIPIDNTKVYLTDENKNIIYQEDTIGEIVISGNGVTLGLDNMYYTGDFGYIKNGLLHCIGRKDSLVKINSNRIDLGDIKQKFKEYPHIKDAEILFDKNNLYAYIIVNKEFNKDKLKEYLKSKLPAYAIPKNIKVTDNFPLLENGKLDKKRLTDSFNSSISFHNNEILKLMHEVNAELPSDITFLKDACFDSLDLLVFTEKLSRKYIKEQNRTQFIKDFLYMSNNITLKETEEMVKTYDKK